MNRDQLDTEAMIEKLNDLIELDFDAVKAYEEAIDRVDDAEVRADLEAFEADHERHTVDLGAVVRDLGGSPATKGDLKGLLIEGLTKLRSVTGTVGALKAMRMNEQLTNRAYDKALDHALSPIARAVVERNRDDERRHLAAIEAHIDRLRTLDDVDVDVEQPTVGSDLGRDDRLGGRY